MRTYGTISPTFWTRGSGKKLRGKPYAQVLALYLMTGSTTNMIGLYYVPRITILHDTGIPEAELGPALAMLADVGIAHYDPENELVYLPEGARYQIGEVLKHNDTKRKPILAALKLHGNHPFVLQWVRRYYVPYLLERDGVPRPDATPPGTPPDGVVMTHLAKPNTPRSDLIGSGPDQAKNPVEDAGSKAPDDSVPIIADLQVRAEVWARDPFRASMKYPSPERWAETVELNNLVAQVFNSEPDTLSRTDAHGRIDPRVKVLLERWAEGITQDRMRLAVRGSAQDDWIRSKPTLQSIVTIFKDGNAVDKYCRLAKASAPKSPSKRNETRKTADALEAERKFRNGEF